MSGCPASNGRTKCLIILESAEALITRRSEPLNRDRAHAVVSQ